MQEYASNSHKSKREQTESQETSEKNITPVVQSGVKKKKKSEFKALVDDFVATDMPSIKNYILKDVLIPNIKKAISEGIDALLYGENHSSKKSSNASKISYRSYYDRPDDNRIHINSSTKGFDYDDLVFDNRGDAERVLDSMNDILLRYGIVSVADLYDIAGVDNTNFNANKYGWTDIRGCKAVRVYDGYALKLPRAVPID